jgi:chaperonin GroEL
MSKVIKRGEEARELLAAGIKEVVACVETTLGPCGHNAVLPRYGTPLITNDGVSIAKDVEVDDPIKSLGVEIAKEIAIKANDAAGDGTTTSLVLTGALVDNGLAKGKEFKNLMEVRRGMERAKDRVVEILKDDLARPVKGKEEIARVAAISLENSELGGRIMEAIDKVGLDGAVTVEESPIDGVHVEVTKGLQFDNGFISPYMVNDPEKQEVVYTNIPILITDKTLSAVNEVLPYMDKLVNNGQKELLIIAESVEGEALATVLINKVRGIFNGVAVKAPGFGERKKEILQDLAVAVGTDVISQSIGLNLESVQIEKLGFAQKVIVSKDKTIIIGGKANKEDLDLRIGQLKQELEKTESKHDQEQIKTRISRLSGGVAVIKVGAGTETEARYLKLKIEDAVNATKAAIEEGIVPGGGAALLKARNKLLMDWPKDDKNNPAFQAGIDIVCDSLLAPFCRIASNAGKSAEEITELVGQVENGIGGYDADVDKVVADVMEAGIIDPVKVTRTSLERAVSAVAMLITTETAIAHVPDKNKENI